MLGDETLFERLLMEETIPRPVNLSFHASEQCAPKVAISRILVGFTGRRRQYWDYAK
jgi:hypothetical protein